MTIWQIGIDFVLESHSWQIWPKSHYRIEKDLFQTLPPVQYVESKKSYIIYDWILYVFYSETVGQINQEYRLKYWATCSSVRLFARTAHSFICSALLASLAHSAVLICSLARSLRSLPPSWDSEWLDDYLFCVFFSVLAHSVFVFTKQTVSRLSQDLP